MKGKERKEWKERDSRNGREWTGNKRQERKGRGRGSKGRGNHWNRRKVRIEQMEKGIKNEMQEKEKAK